MFDLRYHVASLAAVFLALVIGILVGVGIADRGYVDKAQRGLLEQRIAKLRSDLSDARTHADNLAAQQRATQAFVTDTYPELMANRLRGKSIALVFLGPSDAHIQASLEQALTDAGASGWVRVRALKFPLDVPQIDNTLAGDPALARHLDLDVVARDRRGVHDDVSALHMGGLVAGEDLGAETLQALDGFATPAVRAADAVAHGEHHLGDSAHPGSADAHEVNVLVLFKHGWPSRAPRVLGDVE